MIEFFTPVSLPVDLPAIAHADVLMSLGSCFAEAMGERLKISKFRCDVNPFGILYNPLSIAEALQEMMEGKVYGREDLFWHNGCWHSPMHHSDFSADTVEETLRLINGRLQAAAGKLGDLDFLLLTFGSAVVYEDKDTGRVVGNCHKLPERNFLRRRLSVDEIVEEYAIRFLDLFDRNARLKVYFTVSPIRYLRDGLHESQLSKATLLLAVEEICKAFPGRAFYFPAYEIVTDELRDYRFYADDMVHPSAKAVDYVWQRFCEIITPESRGVMAFCEDVHKMLCHKPFRPESDEYKRFLEQIVLKIDRLNEKYPYLDFEKERETCHIQLKKLQKP